MTCLIKSAHKEYIDDLAKTIAYSSVLSDEENRREYERNYQMYFDIAYHALACNNGHPMYADPQGKESVLFKQLMSPLYFNGDIKAATAAKMVIYTRQFADKYGEWIDLFDESGNPFPEPQITDLDSKEQLQHVKDLFGDFAQDANDYMNDLMSGFILNSDSVLRDAVYESRQQYIQDQLNDNQLLIDSEVQQAISDAKLINPDLTSDQETAIRHRVMLKHCNNYSRDWNRRKINLLVSEIKRKFQMMWDITDEDLEDIKQIKDDVKSIRAMIIESMDLRKDDPVFMKTISRLIKQAAIGNGKINEEAMLPFVDEYINLISNTNWFKQMLTLAYGVNANNYNTLVAAKTNLIKELHKTIKQYYRTNKTLSDRMKNLMTWLWDGLRTVLYTVIWPFGRLLKVLDKFKITFPIVDFETGQLKNKTVYTTNKWLDRKEINYQFRKILELVVLCEDFSNNKNVSFMSSIASSNKDVLQTALEEISKNIEIRKASIERAIDKSTYGISDLEKLKLLEYAISDALNAQYELKIQKSTLAISMYVNTALTLIADADAIINSFEIGERVPDLKQLMYIKTDIIGAYDNVFSNVFNQFSLLMNNSPIEQLKENGELRTIILTLIAQSLNNTKLHFQQYLRKYLKQYVDQYVDATAGHVLGNEKLDLFKFNMQLWMQNAIDDGSINAIQKYIVPTRANSSPMLRFAHNRFTEMNQLVHEESLKLVSDLESLRTKQRSALQRINPFEMNKKYMEILDNGELTSNLISDLNYGKYEREYKDEKERLRKKLGITKNPYTNQYSYPGNTESEKEQVWKDYQIALYEWMGNIKRDADGNYILLGRPRVHLRYKAQYYIDRISILGRLGTERLTGLNSAILEILKDVTEDVTYIANGVEVTKRVPLSYKLDPFKAERLDQLMTEKQMLASPFYFDIDFDGSRTGKEGTIINVIDKTDTELEIAMRVAAWNQKKKSYYDEQVHNNPQFHLYDAVINKLQGEIDEANTELQNQVPGTQEYLNSKEKVKSKKLQLSKFINLNTISQINPVLYQVLKTKTDTLYETDNPNENTKRYILLLQQRRAIINRITKNITSGNSTQKYRDLDLIGENMWSVLLDIDKTIYNLEQVTGPNAVQKKVVKTEMPRGIEWKQMFSRNDVHLYIDGTDTGTPYIKKLIRKYGYAEAAKRFQFDVGSGKKAYLRVLRETIPDSKKAIAIIQQWSKSTQGRELSVEDAAKLIYLSVPTGAFAESKSNMIDEEFDGEYNEYFQIDKTTYDNTAAYEKIKNDPYYKKLLQMLDYGWQNLEGVKRGWRYKLPQREASTSAIFARELSRRVKNAAVGNFLTDGSFSQSARSNFVINNRDDIDVQVETEDIIRRADNTVIEQIPTRWVKDLENKNNIDADLVSLIGDFVQESLRYKYRTRLAPLMDALMFELSGGGWTKSPDAGSADLADILQSEIASGLYGREIMGSGINGRLKQHELILLKASKKVRSAMHNRLMGHNWMSVLKNGYDSFMNVLNLAFTGKYILGENLRNALKYLNPLTLIPALTSFTRSGTMNMTQGLMQKNGVTSNIHDLFKGQNKTTLRKILSKSASIEFEPIDYTAKAFITEAVYDAYRFVYNPITNKYEFLNEQECELAYTESGNTRQSGYDAWKKATTLRNAYRMDYTTEYDGKDGEKRIFKHRTSGVVDYVNEFTYKDANGVYRSLTRDELIDVIRPKIDKSIAITDDSRSNLLETKVRNTIKQVSLVANGMLDQEDKSTLAKNYIGALAVSFRGWMVSQGSEFYMTGTDFYDYRKNNSDFMSVMQNNQNGIAKAKLSKNSGVLVDDNFKGIYSFHTGTIGQGLHKIAITKILKNLHNVALMMLSPAYMPIRDFAKFAQSKLNGGDQESNEIRTGNAYWIEDRHLTLDETYALKNITFTTLALLTTTLLTCAAASWYNDDDDDYKGIRALIYASLIASLSERFSQTFGGFLTNGMELIKSVTVATSMILPIIYMCQSILNIAAAFGSNFDENDNLDEVIKQGTYKGRTKGERINTEALGALLAILGIDLLPYELVLGYQDYNVNWYKSNSYDANMARAKWYGSLGITKPLDTVVRKQTDDKFNVLPKKQESKNKSKLIKKPKFF